MGISSVDQEKVEVADEFLERYKFPKTTQHLLSLLKPKTRLGIAWLGTLQAYSQKAKSLAAT